MDTLTEAHDSPKAESDVFVLLIFGLHQYLKSERFKVPNSLRRALNALSFAMPVTMPKTLHSLIEKAHTPVSEWYPFATPEEFNRSQPLLFANYLSEEAQDYQLELSEKMEISPDRDDIPQSALDNLLMQNFRDRLRHESNKEQAQKLYETVRLFLITHSWITLDMLRSQSSIERDEIRPFYQDVETQTNKTMRICDRCGLLRWQDGYWVGIKPEYCSDHADDSPLIHDFPTPRQFLRLKEGIHLRTFIPGTIERKLFDFADEMWETYPDNLISVERYPGIDTYDLRLEFGDGTIWAVDAKDQRYPNRLAKQIKPPYGEGALTYTHCSFVLPDERYEEDGYITDLERELARQNVTLSERLGIRSLSAFWTEVEEKLKSLAKRKGRR